ncbi:hypothetical protein CYLTODRAFT_495194 [Cylindrobasidium torrendii FP15055 ss-10]|uniref:Uncharacterized protein n=1 Tax=Cylindrobasidium torrendii FP15055 ss-10 TaxID=1314674 RepID=A0A0D7AWA6_9AGAR|nr:hypothetical protein CYLTODRAFT_495194 [Cylindrobasidium torrendii FP15055 ss-10]
MSSFAAANDPVPLPLLSMQGSANIAAPPSSTPSSSSTSSSDSIFFYPASRSTSPVINDLGLVVDVCYHITDRWLESRDAAVLQLRHRVRCTQDVLRRPAGSFEVGDMRYLFEEDFSARCPRETWFAHGQVPYLSRFDADTLDMFLGFCYIYEYETFLWQVEATNGPNILKLLYMMWEPPLATLFFNALNVPEHRFGADIFYEHCTEMLRPRQWEKRAHQIQATFRQLMAADRGTRNRLGRLGFPVEACADPGIGLPPFLPAVGKVY